MIDNRFEYIRNQIIDEMIMENKKSVMTNEQLRLEEYNKEVFGDTPEKEHKITLEFLIQFHRAFRNHNQLEKND